MVQELTHEQLANYADDRRLTIMGSIVTFLILGNISVAARIFTELRTRRRIFSEDIHIVLAVVCLNVVIGNLLAASHYGLGLHTWRVNFEDPEYPKRLTLAFKHVWVCMVFNGPTFTCIKLSLLFFYRRIFLVHQWWLRVAWWVNLGYLVLWFFGATGFYLFQCWPVSWYWKQYYKKFAAQQLSHKDGQCNATTVSNVALPLIFGLVSDVALLFLPTAALSQLQMSLRKKVGLVFLFSLGAVACALELVRIIVLELRTDDKEDPSYNVVDFLILSAATEVVAIICTCLPIIAPQIVRDYRGVRRAVSSGLGTRSQQEGGSNGFIKMFNKNSNSSHELSQRLRGESDKNIDSNHGTPQRPRGDISVLQEACSTSKAIRAPDDMDGNLDDDHVYLRRDVEVTEEHMTV